MAIIEKLLRRKWSVMMLAFAILFTILSVISLLRNH